jgi:hypothetical protein
MKKSCHTGLLLFLSVCLFISCQKQDLEVEAPRCQSIAYVIDKTDSSHHLIETDTSIYWPQVCGEDLQRFMAMSKKPQPLCGQPGASIRLVIWTPTLPKALH